jgi:hypothetical protein
MDKLPIDLPDYERFKKDDIFIQYEDGSSFENLQHFQRYEAFEELLRILPEQPSIKLKNIIAESINQNKSIFIRGFSIGSKINPHFDEKDNPRTSENILNLLNEPGGQEKATLKLLENLSLSGHDKIEIDTLEKISISPNLYLTPINMAHKTLNYYFKFDPRNILTGLSIYAAKSNEINRIDLDEYSVKGSWNTLRKASLIFIHKEDANEQKG